MDQQPQQSQQGQPQDEEEFFVNDSGFVDPPVGVHRAVCVDVVKITVRSKFKLDAAGVPLPQDKVSLVFELEAKMDDGNPYIANQLYTPSLHVRAKMREHLEGWRGVAFSGEELKKFNVVAVLGKPCQLLIQIPPGKERARITSIMKPTQPYLTPSGKYIRKKDRPKDGAGQTTSMAAHIPGATATATATATPAAEKPPF